MRYEIEPVISYRVFDTKSSETCHVYRNLDEAWIHREALETGNWDEYERTRETKKDSVKV